MTDTAKSWIEERRATHAAATPGKWDRRECSVMGAREASDAGRGPARLASMDMPHRRPRMEANATAIVDAHNTLPRALNALEQVLELHKPEAFEDAYSMQSGFMCESCYDPDKNEWVEWPCPTVQAVQTAIEGGR